MHDELLERLWNGTVDCQNCKIRDLVLFSHLKVDDFNHIHKPINDIAFQQGDYLYREGERGKYIYTVRSGMVKLETSTLDGECKIVRLLKMGDVIGLEVILGKPYQHNAIMLEPGDTCRIPVEVVKNLQRHSDELCNGLMERWQKALDSADCWLSKLHSGQARQRVSQLITYLEENSVNRPEFFLPSREDMSAILALTKETVSRIVADMRRDGELIAHGGGAFEAKLKK